MANKRKRVDIVSVQINNLSEKSETPTFQALLAMLRDTEVLYEGKLYELRLLETEIDNCIIGIVETTQNKEIPPIKNRNTKMFSQVNINTEIEGLAFANIFLYDSSLNVLIYEVNRNGCYLRTLKELVEKKWAEHNDKNQIQIELGVVCRLDEYKRMLEIQNYRKINCQICCPSEVLREVRQQEQSLARSLLEAHLSIAEQSNINVITIEQKCLSVRLNREGMQAGFVKDFVSLVKNICGLGQRTNIKNCTVHGYTLDPESEKAKSTSINLLADVFDEYILIPEVQIQSSLQEQERKASIEVLYHRISPELKSIIHGSKV